MTKSRSMNRKSDPNRTPTDAELQKLIKKGVDAFEKMSPEQQAIHRRDQHRSFVSGNLGMSRPDEPIEETRGRVERLLGPRGT